MDRFRGRRAHRRRRRHFRRIPIVMHSAADQSKEVTQSRAQKEDSGTEKQCPAYVVPVSGTEKQCPPYVVPASGTEKQCPAHVVPASAQHAHQPQAIQLSKDETARFCTQLEHRPFTTQPMIWRSQPCDACTAAQRAPQPLPQCKRGMRRPISLDDSGARQTGSEPEKNSSKNCLDRNRKNCLDQNRKNCLDRKRKKLSYGPVKAHTVAVQESTRS